MRYQNPILRGDYSDPDVIRVGGDYYMVSSSFTYFPGIPLLHSTDLVHWEIINHVAPRLPFASYDEPHHKCGLWAPSIRYREGNFYIYACTPDEGLLAFIAQGPRGSFVAHHIKDVSGWIDPCPFWDDDGQAYLIHAFSASRAGIKNRLYLHKMSADGLTILDDGTEVFVGDAVNVTTEGPKMYKIDGTYWILCPSGGVPRGWQLAMKSGSIYGPYQWKRVLEQKGTPVNGPHQGGLVDTPNGKWWFIHFQDRDAYGRVPHLQPVAWRGGYPVMGDNGAPVPAHEMPAGTSCDYSVPTSDSFRGKTLGLQWQWQAHENPRWYELNGGLRLFAYPTTSLFHAGQYLSQLMQSFRARWEVPLTARFDSATQRAGVGMMGYTYRYLSLEQGLVALYEGTAAEVNRREKETVRERRLLSIPYAKNTAAFTMEIADGSVVFGCNGRIIGDPFPMAKGGWTSARPGVFCADFDPTGPGAAWADFHEVRITDLDS
ncbi:MAG: family 43 glycosylhydrolase [Clostridiales bacterium]|nr:family 43 glycosylhydrolase [Clostridiales bacterium]